jgi:ADP-ribosylglycohydrolase
MSFENKVRRSMLWSAYGDAAGFITELASQDMVRRRVGETRVTRLVPWTRRVGGKFGIDIPLPSGCYSDDTQLRLATSRAIRGDGTFDVEVFAKVELPVWRVYALGGGTSTKAAAQALAKPNTQWCTNFFQTNYVRYTDGGGNGAAMRIQPHVWSAPEARSKSDILRDIVRNTIATHGHMRAIIGATFHGLCLLHAIRKCSVPTPVDWVNVSKDLRSLDGIIRKDDDLNTLWLPIWEQETEMSLNVAIEQTLTELDDHISSANIALDEIKNGHDRQQVYTDLVNSFNCFSRENRGSATKTAVLASFLAVAFDTDPRALVETCVNLLDTDTDTIGTMAAAIIGAVASSDPPEKVADFPYVVEQARRLARLSLGQSVESFHYPDLLFWKAPGPEIDYIGRIDHNWAVVGLGKASPLGEPHRKATVEDSFWQWFQLEFGQDVLLKCRTLPQAVVSSSLPIQNGNREKAMTAKESAKQSESKRFSIGEEGVKTSPAQQAFNPGDRNKVPHKGGNVCSPTANDLSLDAATDAVIKSGFDPNVVGTQLMAFAERENGIELAIAFASIIAKAKQARMKRSGKLITESSPPGTRPESSHP